MGIKSKQPEQYSATQLHKKTLKQIKLQHDYDELKIKGSQVLNEQNTEKVKISFKQYIKEHIGFWIATIFMIGFIIFGALLIANNI